MLSKAALLLLFLSSSLHLALAPQLTSALPLLLALFNIFQLKGDANLYIVVFNSI